VIVAGLKANRMNISGAMLPSLDTGRTFDSRDLNQPIVVIWRSSERKSLGSPLQDPVISRGECKGGFD
jgi:hypothetical protein